MLRLVPKSKFPVVNVKGFFKLCIQMSGWWNLNSLFTDLWRKPLDDIPLYMKFSQPGAVADLTWHVAQVHVASNDKLEIDVG